MKERTDNLEFIKINIFLSEKDIIKRMKRDAEWEKIFAKDISYKEPYPQYKKNSNNPTIRRGKKKLLFFFFGLFNSRIYFNTYKALLSDNYADILDISA